MIIEFKHLLQSCGVFDSLLAQCTTASIVALYLGFSQLLFLCQFAFKLVFRLFTSPNIIDKQQIFAKRILRQPLPSGYLHQVGGYVYCGVDPLVVADYKCGGVGGIKVPNYIL